MTDEFNLGDRMGTEEEWLRLIAQSGYFAFMVYLRNAVDTAPEPNYRAGDGQPILTEVIAYMTANPTMQVLIEDAGINSGMVPITLAQVTRIKELFVEIYGDIPKINVYLPGPEIASEL